MWKAFEEMEQLGWVVGPPSKDDRRPGLRLRTHRQGLERRRSRLDEFRKRRHLCRRTPRAQALRRLNHPRHRPRIRRHRRRLARRNDPRVSPGLVAQRRPVPLPRRRLRHRRLRPSARDRLSQAQRPRSPLQYRSGLKYIDAIAEAMHLARPGAKKYPQRTPVGGIITPQ